MDIMGGTASLLQMVFIAANTNDWKTFLGNPAKCGIGIASILFDIVFIVQHYVLYRNNKHEYRQI